MLQVVTGESDPGTFVLFDVSNLETGQPHRRKPAQNCRKLDPKTLRISNNSPDLQQLSRKQHISHAQKTSENMHSPHPGQVHPPPPSPRPITPAAPRSTARRRRRGKWTTRSPHRNLRWHGFDTLQYVEVRGSTGRHPRMLHPGGAQFLGGSEPTTRRTPAATRSAKGPGGPGRIEGPLDRRWASFRERSRFGEGPRNLRPSYDALGTL